MPDTVYKALQKHLDGLAVRFPETESGIEIAILKKIFTPEEAGMAVHLSPRPETAESLSRRTGLEPQKTQEMLERMSGKGQIFRMKGREGEFLYNAASFVPGIWEYQVESLDHELAGMVEKYFDEALGKIIHAGTIPLFRVLPLDDLLEMEVMPYDQAKEFLKTQKSIALTDCICRKEKRLAGHGCDHVDDVCLIFSHMARYYVDNGLGRFITADEAIEVLDRAEKDGLVHSPQNAQNPMGFCNCCGCCCGILRGITQFDLPASKVIRSDFYCVCDADICSGCGECLDRCQVKAIELVDDIAVIDREQCIGCGLCVSTCSMEALRIVRKPSGSITPPLPSVGHVFQKLAEDRAETRSKDE